MLYIFFWITVIVNITRIKKKNTDFCFYHFILFLQYLKITLYLLLLLHQ